MHRQVRSRAQGAFRRALGLRQVCATVGARFSDAWRAFAGWLARRLRRGRGCGAVPLLGHVLGQELFPNIGATQFRLRFDAPDRNARGGDRAAGDGRPGRNPGKAAGPGNVAISLGYVGTQGASYPINTVFLWTSGPHEAVMNVALRPEAGIDVAALEEKLRQTLPARISGLHVFVRAGRHRQPDHEFRRAHSGRGGGDGTESGGDPRLHGKIAQTRWARSATCAT